MRCLYALLAAILSLVLALVVVAGLSLVMRDEPLLVVTAVCFTLFPILAFVWVYWIARKRNAGLHEEVEERRRLALSRRLPEKALAIAQGGDGVWLTDGWRVTGGNTPTIEVVGRGARRAGADGGRRGPGPRAGSDGAHLIRTASFDDLAGITLG